MGEVESPEGIDSSDADPKKDFPGGNASSDENKNVPKLQHKNALASAVKENPQTPEEVESPEGIDSSDADPKKDFPSGNSGTDENKNVPKLQDTDALASAVK